MEYYQQGDVLIVLSEVPNEAKKTKAKNRGYVLAEGEATGHTHVVESGEDVEMYELNGTLYMSVKKETEVEHEEHDNITIPIGDYKISKILEWDSFEEEAREVLD